MDMELTEEQAMLQSAARRFLEARCPLTLVRELEASEEGFSRALWAEMARLGWLGLPLPPRYGGSGASMVDLCVLQREMGRALVPGPYLSTTVLGAGVLASAGSEAQRSRWLPEIARGGKVMTLAMGEQGTCDDPSAVTVAASAAGSGHRLTGAASFVEFAGSADALLVAARENSAISLFLVDPNRRGVRLHELSTLGRDRQSRIELDQVEVSAADRIGDAGGGWPPLRRAVRRTIVACCAQMAGAAERAKELAVEYAKIRVQFGKPIGALQSIQHHLATAHTENTGADTLACFAAWALDEGELTEELFAITKAFVGETCNRTASIADQIFGGLGGVEDTDITLFLRRAKQAQLMYGGIDPFKDRLAAAVLDD